MTRKDYERLATPNPFVRKAHFTEYDPAQPRTLLISYDDNTHRVTHVYITSDGFHILRYVSGCLKKTKMSHIHGRYLQNTLFTPEGKVIPEMSDYAFCHHLCTSGVPLSFADYDETENRDDFSFCGPTVEDFT